MKSDSNAICCPEFNPELWDEKLSDWQNKKFIKDSVCTLLYMPLNFGRVMKRLDAKTTNAGANIVDYLCLANHTSYWNMDIYLAVDKEISDAMNVVLTGKYYSKVYEGSFKDTGKWTKDFEQTAKSKDLIIRKMFFWYTTCPKCAKKYGKNYVVLVGQID